MKNLAGNDVSIFLFRFDLLNNAISFVLSESIAEDMYPEIDVEMQPLVQACGETLVRYKNMCRGKTIMDGNILTDGHFEVMLSKGLGQHLFEKEKQNLFNDAHEIAKLLMDVMDRRTKEAELGEFPGPQPLVHKKVRRTESTNKGMQELASKRQRVEDLVLQETKEQSGMRALSPEDLPTGVLARRGYDHRGRCIAFEHKTLGDIGKIILIDTGIGKVRIEAEISKGKRDNFGEREKLLKEIYSLIEVSLSGNQERETAGAGLR